MLAHVASVRQTSSLPTSASLKSHWTQHRQTINWDMTSTYCKSEVTLFYRSTWSNKLGCVLYFITNSSLALLLHSDLSLLSVLVVMVVNGSPVPSAPGWTSGEELAVESFSGEPGAPPIWENVIKVIKLLVQEVINFRDQQVSCFTCTLYYIVNGSSNVIIENNNTNFENNKFNQSEKSNFYSSLCCSLWRSFRSQWKRCHHSYSTRSLPSPHTSPRPPAPPQTTTRYR